MRAMARKDYYEVLGVTKGADDTAIKAAYKKLARRYHPDLNKGNKAAEERFKEIAEAYAVLGTPEKRAEYDRRGPEGFDLGVDPSEFFRHVRSSGGGGGFQGSYGGFDLRSLFGDLFAGGTGRPGRPGGPMRGADAEASLTIEFEDAIRGITLPLSLNRAGRAEAITVRIPAGVDEGSRVRIPGKGQPGPGGGPAGDLYVQIGIRPHPRFRREGDHLVMELPLTVTEATLGGRIEVKTLDGRATMTIPPGTRSGQRFRLRGKGAPRPGSSGSGDLYVDVQIVPPKPLDDESRDLLRRFAERNPQHDLRD